MVNKYLDQYKERNYAPKQRKIEKSDLTKHCNRSESRKTTETSCGNSDECGREEQKEEVGAYGRVVILTEEEIVLREEAELVYIQPSEEAIAKTPEYAKDSYDLKLEKPKKKRKKKSLE